MLKHIVFWNLSEEGKQENLLKMKEMLLDMKGKVDLIRNIEVGLDINKGMAAYEIALVVELDNEKALAEYQNHPEHEKVKEFVGSVAVQRAVVDYFVE